MPNVVPYLTLAAIFMPLLPWMLIRYPKTGAWVLWLAYSGMIYLFEFIVLVVLNGYEYRPNVLPIRFYDNALGAVDSDLLAIPVVALLVSVLELNGWWIIALSVMFGGIESAFLYLHVYQHHWWRTIYTILTLALYFRYTREWRRIMMLRRSPVRRYVSLLTLAISLTATISYIFALSGVRQYHSGIYTDVYRDDIFTGSLVTLLEATIYATFVFAIPRLVLQALAVPVIIGARFALSALGIMHIFLGNWPYVLITATCCLATLWVVARADRVLCSMDRSSR